jgi:hypothetical protein
MKDDPMRDDPMKDDQAHDQKTRQDLVKATSTLSLSFALGCPIG